MLRFLSIRNLAVVDRLELEFDPGLNVLTGETGAGKSIIVTALGLLVGGRSSGDLVRTGEELAAIDAVFETADGQELLVRREVSAQSGRSRAFLDGTLVTSAAVRQVGSRLVELHGQHEHQLLLDPASHLDLLDSFAGLRREVEGVGQAFARWHGLRAERDRLLAGERDKARRAEFLEFQLAEIRRVAPKPNEDDELASARQVLANADRLQRLCAEAYTQLYEGDGAALASLSIVWKKLGDLAAIDAQFRPYAALREAIKPQLEDLAYFLRSYAAEIDSSPARLQEVEDRLATLERLKKKHGPALADVLERERELQAELDSIAGEEARLDAVGHDLAAARDEYVTLAENLSRRRREAAVEFTGRLERSLADLAMNRARCDVRFEDAAGESAWTERGTDSAELYLSANPGEELRPLARIASGGELSRIMLALKTLAASEEPGKTLVFDEVDAGIGGAVADSVGARLRGLSASSQVLCITHLPQIAAYGGTHFRILKEVSDGRTRTVVTRLSPREREEEIARMIAGTDVSAAVRNSAREMLRRKKL